MELKKYEKDITSQNGEDGVINEIFNRIGAGERCCCEFGAWDGIHLSNCWNLWNNESWKAVLIEGDEQRCSDLKLSTEKMDNVEVIHSWVEIEGENSISNIIDRSKIVKHLDLLSIDIDSDDCAIFDAMRIRPRLVVIEYNPSIPPHINLVQKPGENLGNSISSTVNVATKKKYKLAYISKTNLFFVTNEEFAALGIEEVNYLKEFPYENLTCIINTYDGRSMLSQPMPHAPYIEPVEKGFRNYVAGRLSKKKQSEISYSSNKELIPIRIMKE